jgi:hypothetical protein
VAETDEERAERRKKARALTHAEMYAVRGKFRSVLDMIDHDLERNDEVMKKLGGRSEA